MTEEIGPHLPLELPGEHRHGSEDDHRRRRERPRSQPPDRAPARAAGSRARARMPPRARAGVRRAASQPERSLLRDVRGPRLARRAAVRPARDRRRDRRRRHANEAARAGLAVALVDRGDFGAATSSASSKLIHGGLRYLRLGDVRLVREAHANAARCSHTVAPHLVRRLPFLFPLYRDGPYRPRTLQAGLALYSMLARDGSAACCRRRARVRASPTCGSRACAAAASTSTRHARQPSLPRNVRAAAAAGAVVANYAEVVELRQTAGRVSGAEVRDRGRARRSPSKRVRS